MSTALSPVTASSDCHRLETPCAYALAPLPKAWPGWPQDLGHWFCKPNHGLPSETALEQIVRQQAWAIKKNAQIQQADQECLHFLLDISFTCFGTGNSHFKWIYFFKSTPDSCIVLFGTHQWCPVRHDMIFFCMLCMAKQFQNVSCLVGSTVITKPMWPSQVTQMAVLLFLWVSEAYQWPANATFHQLDLIQTL